MNNESPPPVTEKLDGWQRIAILLAAVVILWALIWIGYEALVLAFD